MLLQRLQVPLRIISAGQFARHQCPLSNIKIWTIQQASKAEEDSLHLIPEILPSTFSKYCLFYTSVYITLRTSTSNMMLLCKAAHQ